MESPVFYEREIENTVRLKDNLQASLPAAGRAVFLFKGGMMNKNRTVPFIVLMFLFFRVNVVLGDTTFVHVIDFKNGRFSPDVELAIEYKDGKLNLFIRSKTVGEIFKEIEKKGKIEIKVDEETAQKKVSIFVSGKTLKEGIEAVLNTIGQRDLAISYRDVSELASERVSQLGTGNSQTRKPANPQTGQPTYEINKVEIRKRTKAEMEKIEAEEEKTRQEKYQKKEKWYHNLFKDMGKKGKLEGMLKDYAEGKNRIDVETYLRQATFKPEEKPLLREALRDPKYSEISGAISMGLTHAIIDKPEESDKEFILEALKERKAQFLIFTLKFIWDERFIPVLIKDVKELHSSTAAEILGVHKVKEAVPALEEAMVECPTCGMGDALERITGKYYRIKDGKAVITNEPPKFIPPIIESIEGR